MFVLSLGLCMNTIVLELMGFLGKVVNGVLLIWVLILKSSLKLQTMICLIKCVTVFTACHLYSLLITLLITCLISDHVVTTCHFLLSKRFCLKIVSLWELSLSRNSLFLFFFIEYAWHLLLFNTYCLCYFIVFVNLIILIVLCSCSCNSVRMSLNSIKGNLLT